MLSRRACQPRCFCGIQPDGKTEAEDRAWSLSVNSGWFDCAGRKRRCLMGEREGGVREQRAEAARALIEASPILSIFRDRVGSIFRFQL